MASSSQPTFFFDFHSHFFDRQHLQHLVPSKLNSLPQQAYTVKMHLERKSVRHALESSGTETLLLCNVYVGFSDGASLGTNTSLSWACLGVTDTFGTPLLILLCCAPCMVLCIIRCC